MNFVVLNPGSSTLKFQAFSLDKDGSLLTVQKGSKTVSHGEDDSAAAFSSASQQVMREVDGVELTAIAIRIVHGGEQASEIAPVTEELLRTIASQRDLAPLHTDIALGCIAAVRQHCPEIMTFAAFDSVFHNTMPAVSREYALPSDLRHLRRYGFHGISHCYVSRHLTRQLKQVGRPVSRLITCHLGSGSSMCALEDGRSVDTSMGFTPLEGLIMGTRAGDVDPGLVLYLARTLQMSMDEIDDMLNRKSGLLGLSGLSADTRELEAAAAAGNSCAEAALKAFAYRIRKYIGAYAAVLGGIDGLAFTGGIGEHSIGIRRRIVRKLDFLGLRLSPTKNEQAVGTEPSVISEGPVPIWVIPTDEERQMAELTVSHLSQRTVAI